MKFGDVTTDTAPGSGTPTLWVMYIGLRDHDPELPVSAIVLRDDDTEANWTGRVEAFPDDWAEDRGIMSDR
jgi:hypothetical protein